IDTDKYDFIFLTLTVPNVTGDKLADKISQMQKAFNRLIHYKRFKNAVVGYFRALEVTYNHHKNSKSYDTFHPHYHNILVVRKDYFKSSNYIRRSEWLAMWQMAMNDTSITQVDVRKIIQSMDKKKRGVVSFSTAVAEVAKYTVKSSDYLFKNNPALTDRVVSVLSSALKGRRLVAFGGLFADIRELLNLDDAENGDLIHVETEEEISKDKLFLVRRWNWLSDTHVYNMYEEVVESYAELEERRKRRLEALQKFYAECRKKVKAA
ncbi:MAG: protein rep, partial [Oscillospiraceae bacterium]|nr:protein rep [Oscillospiraceae bacterium]